MAKRWAMAAALTMMATPAWAQDKPADPMAGTQAQDGLFRISVDARGGRILATLPPPGADGVAGRYLYTPAIRSGLGAAPAVLDRGKIGDTQLLAFRRIGKKVAIEFENPRFRSPLGKSADFATSIAWLGDVVATGADGSITIDLAPFLTADTLGIAGSLGNDSDPFSGAPAQGGRGFRLEPALSVANPGSAKVFPRNIEVDAVQTFVTERAGAEVANIAPDPRKVTLTVHHSFVALPDGGFRPRLNDTRIGGISTQAVDYSRPLGADVVFDYANRFRLEKLDPAAARSRVKQPIVFYIDPAAPEWVRGALIEGGNWWGRAFDAAGYIDAFQVKPLPAGADPLDARYSMVTLVDRATRGWAYGQQVVDPRTGEIVRGMVVLGSERARQDIQIYQGLVGVATGQGGPNDPAQVALARLRQLSAHEIGHSLGFAHNFAASTQDRNSVMDYPPPRIGLVGGRPDLSDAYGVGVGGWDLATVSWLYGEPAPGVDAESWARQRAAAIVGTGMRFVQDDNARAPDTAQRWGGLWDDGADPIAELDRLMTVRRAAIERFGVANLAPGEPVANLRRRFVPIYLLHRYQLVAAAKSVGGLDFGYAVREGDRANAAEMVPAAPQRAAIAAILRTVTPAALRLPPALPPLLAVPANGSYNRQFDIELFDTAGGPVFDPLAAADAAAQLAFGTLLTPRRLQRLEVQHAADPAQPGVGELLDRIEGATATPTDSLTRRGATRAIVAMAQAARAAQTPPEAAALLNERVQRIGGRLARAAGDPWARGLSRQLLDREALDKLVAERPRVPTVPPGDPIGGDTGWMDDLLP